MYDDDSILSLYFPFTTTRRQRPIRPSSSSPSPLSCRTKNNITNKKVKERTLCSFHFVQLPTLFLLDAVVATKRALQPRSARFLVSHQAHNSPASFLDFRSKPADWYMQYIHTRAQRWMSCRRKDDAQISQSNAIIWGFRILYSNCSIVILRRDSVLYSWVSSARDRGLREPTCSISLYIQPLFPLGLIVQLSVYMFAICLRRAR